jgi:hypothetical protein
MKLTLQANGHRAPLPLADAHDLCAFYEATGRTIPRASWAEESIAAVAEAEAEAQIEGFL